MVLTAAKAMDVLGDAVGLDAIDAVAGGETAGIPYAAWLAQAISRPMLYVRKKPKGFGRDAQIEGHLTEGSRVLLVEDLATDGASKVNFVDALRTAGAGVEDRAKAVLDIQLLAQCGGIIEARRDAGGVLGFDQGVGRGRPRRIGVDRHRAVAAVVHRHDLDELA